MANDCDFGFLKILLLKLDRLCHYSIKIIFCVYSKPLSVEIMKNGWRLAECQLDFCRIITEMYSDIKKPTPWHK